MLLSLLATIIVAAPMPAQAWGQLGHRIIGQLADERVSGRTRAEILLILGVEDLAEASTWPDEERSNPADFWQNDASPWHYVTVPPGNSYPDVGAPPQGDAASALTQFAATVRDRSAPAEDRALALRFIIHIVGDLHQPLHVGNGADRGGNDEQVTWFREETNLHRVWDTDMIMDKNLSYTEYARWLGRAIAPQTEIGWWTADALVWIAESAAIRPTIYPAAGETDLSYAYNYQNLPIAEQRLQQGGVRLAAYLEWLFSE
ncbi:S1/P1 nuclease [Parasphingopyxis sp. CP4]|nr:S1/P1 nuclease [Parasphingopyxis sp. CP4]